jgi:predicted permease
VEQVKETYRDQGGSPFADGLIHDVRYAVRGLRRNPGFTIVAVLTLALGIGANTAIFTLLNALLLKPLPVTAPERLAVFTVVSPSGSREDSFSYPFYEQVRDTAHTFSGIAASGGIGNLRVAAIGSGASAEPEMVIGERVTGNFFSVLDAEALLGRTFTSADDGRASVGPVIVLSHAFWQRRFVSDPSVVGRHVMVNELPFTVVGVMPPGFFGFEIGRRPDFWWSFQMMPRLMPGIQALMTQPGSSWMRLIGRLGPDASLARAQAEVEVIFQRDLTERARSRGARLGSAFTPSERRAFLSRSIALQPGRTGHTRLRYEFLRPLVILMTVVGIVLLIGCANLANLLLARASARQKEIAVRLAIGAGRSRLVRQLLTESLVLAMAGAALGLLFAQGGAQFLLTYFPPQRLAIDLTPDVRVFGFTAAVSLSTAVLFGLTPAVRATRLELTSGLKAAASTSGDERSSVALNKLLVTGQVALSVFLLIAAGLFIRTLVNLQRLEVGFDRANVLIFSLDIPIRYNAAESTAIYERVRDRLQQLPGVQTTSVERFGLLRDDNWSDKVSVPGYTPGPDEDMTSFGQMVGARFFETMGIPLIEGREFTAEEVGAATQADARRVMAGGAPQAPAANGGRVAIINSVMARRFFGNQSPMGKRFNLRPNEPMEIIGVADDAKYRTLRETTPPTFYVPGGTPGNIVMRTADGQAGLNASIARAIREVDPSVQALRIRTMNEVVNETLLQERFVGRLAGFFGALGLLLASIGLYGVMSYAIARRTREIAIRMALGARRGQVIWMVLRGDLLLMAAGFGIGVPAALVSARVVENLLFGVRAIDPVTVCAAMAVMTVVGAIAGLIPARRASHVDPMVALRNE